ncbi:DUF2007 domain-containing protein [Montanilutibacter psychrotolerans]|uniref:Uncharacterized protein n=1 Tax=Montanilutibacter psychrotolerans TaxID=1327343 RepID=A0A3M8SK49_9GAMM|nr:DUF2007 domain-containing protein [Lysobacter psychrotolerans]RNF81727.1 hypothetical protein EER27_16565 [Lysobacter psychrotolerans]
MRQIFTSPRLENVEGVAALLREAGIEVRVTNGRSYQGGRRREFSYSDNDSPQPAVWVVKSDDQPRARELLREAGLIDTTRGSANSYALPSFRSEEPIAASDPAKRRALMVKIALLGGIASIMVMAVMRLLTSETTPQLASPPFDGKVAATLQPVAQAVFASEIGSARFPVLCLAVDGRPAPARVIDALSKAGGPALLPSSHCERIADSERGSRHPGTGQEAIFLEVSGFRPSAADAGVIEFSAYHHQMYGSYKTLEVKRIGNQWKVTRVIRHVAMQG